MPTAIEQLEEVESAARESPAFQSALSAAARQNSMAELTSPRRAGADRIKGDQPRRIAFVGSGAKARQNPAADPGEPMGPPQELAPPAGAALAEASGAQPTVNLPRGSLGSEPQVARPDSMPSRGSMMTRQPIDAAEAPESPTPSKTESAPGRKEGPRGVDLENFRIDSKQAWVRKHHPELANMPRKRRSVIKRLREEYAAYVATQQVALQVALKAWQFREERDPMRPSNIPGSLEGQLGYSILTDQPQGRIDTLRELAEGKVRRGARQLSEAQQEEDILKRNAIAELNAGTQNGPALRAYRAYRTPSVGQTPRITGELARAFAEESSIDGGGMPQDSKTKGKRFLQILRRFSPLIGSVQSDDALMIAEWIRSPGVFVSQAELQADIKAKRLTPQEASQIGQMMGVVARAYESDE